MALTTKTAGPLTGPADQGATMIVEIKILTGTIIDGRRVRPGDVVEAEEQTARYLLATKKAEPYVGSKKKPATRRRKEKVK